MSSNIVGKKVNIPLPPNGSQLVDLICAEFKLELQKHFKVALAYPNATMRIDWSSNFYSLPHEYSGKLNLAIKSEGATVTQLEEENIDSQLEHGSLELGIPTGQQANRYDATSPSPAFKGGNSGQRSNALPPATGSGAPPGESLGRRDINARKGQGIEFIGGKPATANLANLDGRTVAGKVAEIVGDLEKGDSEPMHDSSIVVPSTATTEGGE